MAPQRIGSKRALAAVAAVGAVAMLLCCRQGSPPRPSILLAVLDTTRFDAVSAYGETTGTTPTVDALAAEGLRYTRAYTNASWTLPSHATIFTGLLPSQHGVDWTHMDARDSLIMLAERMQEAGYETWGVSENPHIQAGRNMSQGFERYLKLKKSPTGIERTLAEWGAERSERPLFVFVNIMDSHPPYMVRKTNPYLPATMTATDARAISQKREDYLCVTTPRRRQLEVLRGLYLGDVAQADAKLKRVLQQVRVANRSSELITLVVSDHGEHFGEHGLVYHDVGVREELIHVPLVVHGLPGVEAAVIDSPVQLADLVPSILSWLDLPVPRDLPGRPLPTAPDSVSDARPIVSEHSNGRLPSSPDEPASPSAQLRLGGVLHWLEACGHEDRVFGDMRSVVRYPWKLIWYARYSPQLYDLVRDPREQHDLAKDQPEVVARLLDDLESAVGGERVDADIPRVSKPLSHEYLERLRELGYIE